ncbi:DUF3800 domain-containing protein [Roseovarius aestuarii]|uniref:DUF3800 domain-containing protein n=1 Tax=Roseovarius aestuarii TaxID=475083 RepID=A0A1X7BN81_9RHOB|nr:DUF3800 domain-containing protein [Roseovarius aestuarii]SMC10739.1 hypothetical protein ROA7745_00546 [Roseovarius aestuarii]
MKFTFFVDESGQSGIKKIRSKTEGGASRYMTLGGVLVPNQLRNGIRNRLSKLASEFGKPDLHCSKINHNQICRFTQELAKEKILLFGVISLKETLGSYGEDIEGDDKRYYSKCAQYILERLGLFLKLNGIAEDDVSICFEEGNFDYSALRGLVSKCRQNPIWAATKNLKHINPNSIYCSPKENEKLLQTSDLVAHALFRCVDDGPSTYGIKETRYINELRRRFFREKETQKIIGYGIYPVHKLNQIKADPPVREFLNGLLAEG